MQSRVQRRTRAGEEVEDDGVRAVRTTAANASATA